MVARTWYTYSTPGRFHIRVSEGGGVGLREVHIDQRLRLSLFGPVAQDVVVWPVEVVRLLPGQGDGVLRRGGGKAVGPVCRFPGH